MWIRAQGRQPHLKQAACRLTPALGDITDRRLRLSTTARSGCSFESIDLHLRPSSSILGFSNLPFDRTCRGNIFLPSKNSTTSIAGVTRATATLAKGMNDTTERPGFQETKAVLSGSGLHFLVDLLACEGSLCQFLVPSPRCLPDRA